MQLLNFISLNTYNLSYNAKYRKSSQRQTKWIISMNRINFF